MDLLFIILPPELVQESQCDTSISFASPSVLLPPSHPPLSSSQTPNIKPPHNDAQHAIPPAPPVPSPPAHRAQTSSPATRHTDTARPRA